MYIYIQYYNKRGKTNVKKCKNKHVAKKCFQLKDTHFLPENNLYKILNRNTIKVS